eukprot:TRINITY_DN6139_c0_g4_i1.p1 TRINITY_DN6139_c0_g4~~TRINITY_DN6139_c0_g4_i1.p1  ORF type:complete len:429 (+),score=47.23 TRINITY_DN6139_c0_g4_i1:151-1437(+)
MSSISEIPGTEELKLTEARKVWDVSNVEGPENLIKSPKHMVALCNELLALGYPPRFVFLVLDYFQITDLQTAITAMIKSKDGWMHTFIKEKDNRNACTFCGETFSEHVRSKDIKMQPFVKVEVERNVDEWRTTHTCKICMDGVPLGLEFYLPCGHVYCKSCVQEFLEVNIQNRLILDLSCPEEGCKLQFRKSEIEALSAPEVYQKYVSFRLDHEIMMDNRICWCPRPKCGNHIVNLKNSKYVQCACGAEICFKCGEEKHKEKCERTFIENYKFWARGKPVQRCPKCRVGIEKNDGCLHMQCVNCQYEWCWGCGMGYSHYGFCRVFFGCEAFKECYSTNDLGFKTLVSLILFILSPLLSFLFMFYYISEKSERCYISSYSPCFTRFVLRFLKITAILISILLLGALTAIPVVLFRFYYLVFSLIRLYRD